MDWGKIMNSPGGTMDFLNSFKNTRNTGMDLWNKMMTDATNLYSGKTSVTELPEWGHMQSTFNDQFSKQIKQILQQMASRGISGGPVAAFMGQVGDMGAKGMGDLIQQVYQSVMGGGQNAWTNWLNFRNPMIQASLQSDQIEAQKQMQKMSDIGKYTYGGINTAIKDIMGGISGGMGGGMMGGASGGAGQGGMNFSPAAMQSAWNQFGYN